MEGLIIQGFTIYDDEEIECEWRLNRWCPFCATPDSAFSCACEAWPDSYFVGNLRFGHPGGRMPRLSSQGKKVSKERWKLHNKFYDDFWLRVKKRKARKHWLILKDAIDKRYIALYWMQQTQERLCALGGAGRATDLTNFQNEFVVA